VQWPDGLRPTDERLEPALRASDDYRADLTVEAVLRHVEGRRVTALATDGNAVVVVKVFHGPRARGNHRRLAALADAGLSDIVPASHGCDASGHVGVVGHRPGVELPSVPDDVFVPACRRAGVALRRLHECGAAFDREWTVDDELTQLRRRAPDTVAHAIAEAATAAAQLAGAPLVPSHRDCHPRQLVVSDDHVAWIDLDDCALAPAGLDVGNMLAHLIREHVTGRRSAQVTAAARAAFVEGYGGIEARSCRQWERLSLLRLAGLAETRHRSPAERDALLIALGELSS
jgi:hypothetical protein